MKGASPGFAVPSHVTTTRRPGRGPPRTPSGSTDGHTTIYPFGRWFQGGCGDRDLRLAQAGADGGSGTEATRSRPPLPHGGTRPGCGYPSLCLRGSIREDEEDQPKRHGGYRHDEACLLSLKQPDVVVPPASRNDGRVEDLPIVHGSQHSADDEERPEPLLGRLVGRRFDGHEGRRGCRGSASARRSRRASPHRSGTSPPLLGCPPRSLDTSWSRPWW